MPADARTWLADAFSLWRLDPSTLDAVIDAATSCLVAGLDSPRLRELAGASPRESQFVLEPLLRDALDELGMQDVLASDVHPAALAVMLRRLNAGQITERDLTRWAHANIGHDGDERCQVFVELDDQYDTVEYTDRSVADVDRWVRDEASAFLQGLPPIERTGDWEEAASVAAVICRPRRWRRRFVVRVLPRGRELRASDWDDLWASLSEVGVPWRNVSFESDQTRALVLKRWGDHPDAPH